MNDPSSLMSISPSMELLIVLADSEGEPGFGAVFGFCLFGDEKSWTPKPLEFPKGKAELFIFPRPTQCNPFRGGENERERERERERE